MAVLIYKQRFKQPNYNSTPTKNQAHVTYIGSRPGVMKFNGQDSGLFGVLDGKFRETIPLYEGIAKPKYISDKKINMFRATLSFTTAQAQGLGLNSLEDWQEYVKSQISTIAKANNISIENLEWEAAIHQKRDHPHAHIVFWDKKQKIQVQFVKPNVVDKLRCDLIKNTYPDLLNTFYEKKDISENDLKLNFIEVINGYEDYLMSLNLSEYLDFEVASDNKEYDICGLTKTDVSSTPEMAKFCCEYIRIKNMLPETGRLAYKLLPPEVKTELDTFIKDLISSNEKLSRLVENYVGVQLDVVELYSSPDDIKKMQFYQKKYFDEAVKQLANSILRSMKDIDFYAGDSAYGLTCNTIFGAFCDLARLTRQYDSNMASNEFLKGDISKQARKEKAIENKDKGIGVEY